MTGWGQSGARSHTEKAEALNVALLPVSSKAKTTANHKEAEGKARKFRIFSQNNHSKAI